MKTVLERKKLFAVVLMILISVITGCGGMKPDDAKAYVKAVLDTGYKAEFAEYMKITNSKEEEAQAVFDGNIDAAMSASGVEQAGVSDELIEDYRNFFKELFSKVRYTVSDVKETEEGFEVTVQAEPMQIFSGANGELVKAMEEKVKASEKQISEDDMNKLAFEVLYDLLSERLREPEYGEKRDVTVNVTKDSNGIWNVSMDDLKILEKNLFDEM